MLATAKPMTNGDEPDLSFIRMGRQTMRDPKSKTNVTRLPAKSPATDLFLALLQMVRAYPLRPCSLRGSGLCSENRTTKATGIARGGARMGSTIRTSPGRRLPPGRSPCPR